ncbi:MAG: hypothetical protein R3E87_10295 [Burkholderiaceae bacterium]
MNRMQRFSRSLRRTAAGPAFACIAGCSALQVSVDVYKGPLVSDDQMLQKQAVAMALGAKPLMARLRATLVARRMHRDDDSAYADALKQIEKDHGNLPAKRVATLDWPAAARHLNSALSMYADSSTADCAAGTSPTAPGHGAGVAPSGYDTRLLADYQKYTEALASGKKQSIDEARKQLWDTAIEVGEAGARAVFAQPSPQAAVAQKDLLRHTASLLSALQADIPDLSVGQPTDAAGRDNQASSPDRSFEQSARDTLSTSVRRFNQIVTTDRPEDFVDVNKALATLGTARVASAQVLDAVAAASKTEANRQDAPSVPDSLVKVANALPIAFPNDFDSGRPCLGIDQLATLLAQAPLAPDDAGKADMARWRHDLDTLLISLGERLRFIATNAWLTEEQDQGTARGLDTPEGKANALLETIGNTLLVFADDDYRRKTHTQREGKGLKREANGYLALTRFDPNGAFDEIVRRIEAEIPLVSNASGSTTEPSPPDGAKTAADIRTALASARGVQAAFRERMKAATSAISLGQAYDAIVELVDGANQATLRALRARVVKKNADDPFVSGDETLRIEVLDAHIARLRYRYLDALERGGRNDVGQIEDALAAAYRMRAEMVHVRPASAYLRAMFTATQLQEDPQLRQNNMLNDGFTRFLGAPFSIQKNAQALVNLESLDKAFWQRVNTLRVDGAARTNYVVAKDDVGNWMVKSVGTNVAGIAKTALNLALFNYGGRFDTNFLRAQQVRLELQNPDLDSGQRSALENELKAAQLSTGGGVDDRRQLTTDLRAGFDADSVSAHESIRFALHGIRPGRELALIWAQTLDGSNAKAVRDWQARVSEPTAQGSTTLKEAYRRALDKLEAKPSDAWQANEAVLTSLRALDDYRRELRLAVLNDAALVADETTALAAATSELEQLEASAAKPAEPPKADASPANAAASPPGAATGAAPSTATNPPAGSSTPGSAQPSAAEPPAGIKAARQHVEEKAKSLEQAKARREAAADDIDSDFLGEIRKGVAARLSALEQYRSAFAALGPREGKPEPTPTPAPK